MEETGATILSTTHYEFYGARSCTHARKTIPLVLIHPQLVPLVCEELLTRSSSKSVTSDL